MRKYLLVLIGLCFILSEILLKIDPILGFISYNLLIAGCLIASSKVESLDEFVHDNLMKAGYQVPVLKEESLDDDGKLMIVLMILPIIRIAELFIGFDYLWRSFIVYYLLLFLVVFYSLKFKINPGYTKKWLILLPLMVLVGAAIGVMGNALFNFDKYSDLIFLLPIIAFSEEVLFRGMIQNLTRSCYGGISSILFTSILYGIFSLSFGFPAVIFLFFVSLIISVVYHYTKNIFLAISLNIIIQFFILILPRISF